MNTPATNARRTATAAGLVLVALALTGCGGSAGPVAQPPAPTATQTATATATVTAPATTPTSPAATTTAASTAPVVGGQAAKVFGAKAVASAYKDIVVPVARLGLAYLPAVKGDALTIEALLPPIRAYLTPAAVKTFTVGSDTDRYSLIRYQDATSGGYTVAAPYVADVEVGQGSTSVDTTGARDRLVVTVPVSASYAHSKAGKAYTVAVTRSLTLTLAPAPGTDGSARWLIDTWSSTTTYAAPVAR